jgi:hypothetical protein
MNGGTAGTEVSISNRGQKKLAFSVLQKYDSELAASQQH